MKFRLYLQVMSARHGVFPGASRDKGKDWTDLIAATCGVAANRDQAGRQANGRRQWLPLDFVHASGLQVPVLSVVKETDSASAHYRTARTSRELLELNIAYLQTITDDRRPGPDDPNPSGEAVRLTKVTVVGIHPYSGPLPSGSEGKAHEEILLALEGSTASDRRKVRWLMSGG